MLDAIASLGKLQYSEEPEQLIRSLVRFRRPNRKEQSYYLILDFSTKSRKCTIWPGEFDATPESPRYTPQQLHYVGIVPAAGLQYHATGHDLRHLCSQVLPALRDKLPVDSSLYSGIAQVLTDYFALDTALDAKNRYRYLLDLEACGIGKPGFTDKVCKSAADKERPGVVAKELLDWLKKERQIAPEQVDLFAISIDGQLIAQHPDYIRAVLDDQVSMFEKAEEGICCISGQKAAVSADLTKFKFKYYITDKVNFSSGLSGKFERNFQLSEKGVWQLLLGERYIMNRLKLRLGSFNVYMIPEFLDATAYDAGQIRESINEVYRDVRELAGLKEALKIEEKLNNELSLLEWGGIRTQMLINLLFYEENKNEFKVYRHIKDVSPSRISLLAKKSGEVSEYFHTIAPHFRGYSPSLGSMYYMIPLQVDSKGKVKNPQMQLQLYDSVLAGRKLDRKKLIDAFVALIARVYFQTTGGLQIAGKREFSCEQSGEFAWVRLVWEQMKFVRWLEEIGNLEREGAGENMAIELVAGLEKEQAHLQASGFDEARAALFLLGGAIKFVADAQQEKLKSKPILQKLNFKGIPGQHLHKLISEVMEKATYYRKAWKYFPRFHFDSCISEVYRLLELSGHGVQGANWKLKDSETIHNILSGYAFQVGLTLRARAANGQKPGEDLPDEYAPVDNDDSLEGDNDDEQ